MEARAGNRVKVLDLDPDLATGIDPQELRAAGRECSGELVHVPVGPWDHTGTAQERSLLALIVVEGILCREIGLRDRHLLEFLGPGDILQLPHIEPRANVDSALTIGAVGMPRLGGEVMFTAAANTTLVALSEQFLRAAARWPELMIAVLRRIEAQRESLAVQGLIGHLPRAEHRVLLALWHLGERWGRVTPQGIVLPLALTHDLLGQLIGARRSTVTLAVGILEADHLLARLDDGCWLLTGTCRRRIATIARSLRDRPVLGEAFALRQRERGHGRIAGPARGGAADGDTPHAQPPVLINVKPL